MIQNSIEKRLANLLRRNTDKENVSLVADEINNLLRYVAKIEQDNLQLTLALVKVMDNEKELLHVIRQLKNDCCFYHDRWLSLRSTVDLIIQHGKVVRPLLDQELKHDVVKRTHTVKLNRVV